MPVLPDPDGPLSSHVPLSAISSANKEVKCVLKDKEPDASRSKKRGQYASYTEEEKAKIAKRAAEMGVTSTIRHFKKEFAERPLKESTVRTWVGQYTKQLQLSKEYQKEMRVDKLESKKGRPPLLGNKLDKQVQLYVEELSARKVPINTAIVMSAAEGVVKNHDSNLLLCNGGHIECGKHWAKNFLVRMGYTKR